MLIDDNMALHIEMHIWQTFLVISNTNFVIQKRCVRLGLVICILACSKDEIQHMSQGKETLEKSAKTSKVKKIICQQKKTGAWPLLFVVQGTQVSFDFMTAGKNEEEGLSYKIYKVSLDCWEEWRRPTLPHPSSRRIFMLAAHLK